MALNKQEAAVQEFFLSRGFVVSKIPEADEQTPDFLVKDREHQYLVEVKDKRTNQTLMELLESPLPGDKSLPLGYQNRLAGIIRKSVDQLVSYTEAPEIFKVIWFALNEMTLDKWILRQGEPSPPFLEKVTQRQLFTTLYGYRDIEGYTQNGTSFKTGCFYFRNSDFFRYRKQLQAVIIHTTEEIVFCINDLSEQYHEFCRTALYHKWQCEGMLIIEPSKMEAERGCLVVDGDVDRNDANLVIHHLVQRYNLRHVRLYEFDLFNYPLD
jgi:hypothetical protein